MKFHGKDAFLSLEDNAATPAARVISDYCDSIEIERSVGMADATTIGLNDKEFLAGLAESTITLAGKFDDADNGADHVLATNLGNETPVAFVLGPSGNAAGKVQYSGSCYVSRYSVSAPLEDVVKFAATLQVTGAVTRGTF